MADHRGRRIVSGPDPVGDRDGLLEPAEVPRWVERLDDWVRRQVDKPTPRGLRWLDRLEDRLPVWALPWLVVGLMGGLTAAIYAVAPAIARWIRG